MNKTITALAIMMASFAANASVLPETPVPFKSGTGVSGNTDAFVANEAIMIVSAVIVLFIVTVSCLLQFK